MIRPIALLLAATFAACGTSTAPATDPPEATAGVRHDPPVDPSEIPDGAWMCDMGTVHYSSADKHDGKCPVCGMDLVQKAASH